MRDEGFWKSYADLALGLMAVLALILVMLLVVQSHTTEALADAKKRAEERVERLKRQRQELESEREEFARELLRIMRTSYTVVRLQDKAEAWLRAVFKEGDCRLVLAEDGTLRVKARKGEKRRAAGLYEPGSTRLSARGQAALETCKTNFLRLAYCLSPVSPEATGIDAKTLKARRRRWCRDEDREDADARGTKVLQQLRQGLEALVLEGNTDRVPLGSLSPPRIRDSNGSPITLQRIPDNFTSNAYLGSERARQALGHLLALAEGRTADPWDALPTLMSRVRVESASFGRYQAGPPKWRVGDCPEQGDCDTARNLALRVRWKKKALREPYGAIRTQVCELLADPSSAFSQGLLDAGRDLQEERARFDCEGTDGS